MKDLFFAWEANKATPSPIEIDEKYIYQLWKPSVRKIRPRGVRQKSFFVWWIFHLLRLFSNRDYSLLVVYDGEMLAHRSVVFPRYFRFPFMAHDDLQIGDTWTAPTHRGKGLATFAIQKIIELHAKPDRCFWYVSEADNLPSIRAVQKAGFQLAGEGKRTRRLGLRVLGAYVMDSPHELSTPQS